MFEQTIETTATPRITVSESEGNLTVEASAEGQVTVRVDGEAEDLDLEQADEAVTVSVRRNCTITCPPTAILAIQSCRGNLEVEGVQGPLTLGAVKGNLGLWDVGPVELETVDGSFKAREVGGGLRGGSVRGNVRIYDVEGAFALNEVGGNLRVHQVGAELTCETVRGSARISQVQEGCSFKEVAGSLKAEGIEGGVSADRVAGNARLRTSFTPGATYRVNTEGNLRVYVPEDASLRLDLKAMGGISSRIPDLAPEEGGGALQGTLGDGEAVLEAEAKGRIVLRPLDTEGMPPEDLEMDMAFLEELERIGPMVEARISEAMAELTVRLDEGLSNIDGERVRRQMERAAERGVRAAQRAAEGARRVAEQEAQRARMRAERAQRRWSRASGRKAPTPSEPISKNEQLRVLRLVEEGKITPEEAADLLAALGGQ